ncbi:hypothetical protein ABLE91_02330 [Aquabacter sp. CN5-332]|uniref:hypothetical protein n=1 Tax=Aquabacter sp. CN5-332 TaxID=3156608 RepID=UPI0032B5DFFF
MHLTSSQTCAALLGASLALLFMPDPASAQSAYATPGAAATLPPAVPGTRQFYIATVHLDGTTTTKGDDKHPAEAFPNAALPVGGGYVLTKPDESGKWNMRAFLFSPAQVTVMEGDRVVLNFIGVQGPSHRILVEGADEPVILTRGEVERVEFVARNPGIIRFVSLDRLPSMQGEVVVLAKK